MRESAAQKLFIRALNAIGLLLTLLLMASCAASTSSDYGRYVKNNRLAISEPANKTIACYHLPYPTQNHYYTFTTFLAGYHLVEWEVELGKMLDATLQDTTAKHALGSLAKVTKPICAGDLLIIEVDRYYFTECRASLELTFTVKRGETKLLSNRYAATGLKECGKMYWGGGFAMKNAVQQSTKNALDQVLDLFAQDYDKVATSRITRHE